MFGQMSGQGRGGVLSLGIPHTHAVPKFCLAMRSLRYEASAAQHLRMHARRRVHGDAQFVSSGGLLAAACLDSLQHAKYELMPLKPVNATFVVSEQGATAH